MEPLGCVKASHLGDCLLRVDICYKWEGGKLDQIIMCKCKAQSPWQMAGIFQFSQKGIRKTQLKPNNWVLHRYIVLVSLKPFQVLFSSTVLNGIELKWKFHEFVKRNPVTSTQMIKQFKDTCYVWSKQHGPFVLPFTILRTLYSRYQNVRQIQLEG